MPGDGPVAALARRRLDELLPSLLDPLLERFGTDDQADRDLLTEALASSFVHGARFGIAEVTGSLRERLQTTPHFVPNHDSPEAS